MSSDLLCVSTVVPSVHAKSMAATFAILMCVSEIFLIILNLNSIGLNAIFIAKMIVFDYELCCLNSSISLTVQFDFENYNINS